MGRVRSYKYIRDDETLDRILTTPKIQAKETPSVPVQNPPKAQHDPRCLSLRRSPSFFGVCTCGAAKPKIL